MDQDRKYFKSLLIWTLVLFMIASILGIFILFQPDDDRFQYYLMQVDHFIDTERYSDIPPLLVRASRYADNRAQWFSLFKRSYQACLNIEPIIAVLMNCLTFQENSLKRDRNTMLFLQRLSSGRISMRKLRPAYTH